MFMMILFGCVGAAFGAMALRDDGGILVGLVMGLMINAILGLRKQVGSLEARLALLRQQMTATRVQPAAAEPEPEAPLDPADQAEPAPKPPAGIPRPHKPIPLLEPANQPPQAPPQMTAESVSPPSDADRETGRADSGRLLQPIRAFFSGGNLVVRIGVIILFFGVGFLLKYAADRQIVPVEIRLMGVSIGAMVMLAFGWRLRERKRGYALILQGGAVGVLYLTLFAAFRLYGVLPGELTFILLFGIVVLSSILAVIQDAPALAGLAPPADFSRPC